MTESERISPAEKMALANQFDAVARRLSYAGDLREQRLKHALLELVMLLGGTGEPAAPVRRDGLDAGSGESSRSP